SLTISTSSSMPSSSRIVAASSKISACGAGDAATDNVPPSSDASSDESCSVSADSSVSSPASALSSAPSSSPLPHATRTTAKTDKAKNSKNFFIYIQSSLTVFYL